MRVLRIVLLLRLCVRLAAAPPASLRGKATEDNAAISAALEAADLELRAAVGGSAGLASIAPLAAAAAAAPASVDEVERAAKVGRLVKRDEVISSLRQDDAEKKVQLKQTLRKAALEEQKRIDLEDEANHAVTSSTRSIIIKTEKREAIAAASALHTKAWELQTKLAANQFQEEKREAIVELRQFEKIDHANLAMVAKEQGLLRRLKRDQGATVEDEKLLGEVRDFLAQDEVKELRRTLELIKIKAQSATLAGKWTSAEVEEVEVLQQAERQQVTEAVSLLDGAADTKAWASGGVTTSQDSGAQTFDDGAVGKNEAAHNNLRETRSLKGTLYDGSDGESPSAASQRVRVEPWWVPGQCAALTASPPAAILALRDAHTRALLGGGGSAGQMTAEMLSGASTNNRREMTELAFVAAYLTGRSFLLDAKLNSDFWIYDRTDFETAVPIVEGAAAAKGAAKYGANSRATQGLPIKGLGGVTRKEGMKSMNLKQWISELMRPEYTTAPLLTTHLRWGSPTYVLQLDRTLLGAGAGVDPEVTLLLSHVESVLRECLHVSDEVLEHFMKLRALLPPSYYAVNVRHKKIEVVVKGTIDVPLFECARLKGAGWKMRYIDVTTTADVAIKKIAVPCAVGQREDHMTVGDAVALLDAKPGSKIYIASWHAEEALEKTIKMLGFEPVTYSQLMPQYVAKYNSLPEIKFFRYVVIDELFLAFATQYIADWPSSVTEATVAMQRWIEEMQHPTSSNVFRGKENWRVFVNVTKANEGFN